MALDYWLIDLENLTVGIPPGGEREAARFYVDVLGFESSGRGLRSEGVQLAFDIEAPFRPVEELAALVVSDFEALLARLARHGVAAEQGKQLEFFERVVVHDPFGNGLELIAER